MSAKVEVPINPKVLAWALDESGLSASELADAVRVRESAVDAWIAGDERPTVKELRALASALDRQFAVFLLPAPPTDRLPSIAFRHPLSRRTRSLNVIERRYIRRARRLQSAHRWLLEELKSDVPRLPVAKLTEDPEQVGERFRARLNVAMSDQVQWASASRAFDAWRASVERLGILVLLFPMGEESCRGFSLSDERAPLVAINTAWPDEARIFTLFHEIGHLLTATESACAQPMAGHTPTNKIERWCEAFAAAVMIPVEALSTTAPVKTLPQLTRLARTYKVSLRAMAIRLIGQRKASWSLYRLIPPAADLKKPATGGSGRTLREIREDELGWRGIDVFVEAARREVISRSQALDYLDISAADFDTLSADAHLR